MCFLLPSPSPPETLAINSILEMPWLFGSCLLRLRVTLPKLLNFFEVVAAIKLLIKSYLFDAHADAFNIVNHLPPAVFCHFTRVLKKIGVASGAKALLETD